MKLLFGLAKQKSIKKEKKVDFLKKLLYIFGIVHLIPKTTFEIFQCRNSSKEWSNFTAKAH